MKRALILAAAMAFLVAGASAALADPPEGHNPNGKMLGRIEPKGGGAKGTGGGGLLQYHNGSVMRTNTTYAIFWGPAGSFDQSYVDLINRFFGDVAADSQHNPPFQTNVYWAGTQYSDLTGPIAYNSTVGGSYIDTNPYPSNGCRDKFTPATCLSDTQIQSELQRVMGPTVKGWTGGLDHAFFVFTPINVGSCIGHSCAFSNYCAYHSWIGSGSSSILYANMPYALQTPACDTVQAQSSQPPQHPNGNAADATLDGTSHEHNEMITDPVGTGWFTNGGQEQGDLCNFNYGAPLPTSPNVSTGTAFNQLINGNPYWIQQEWSNHSSACVQRGL